MKFPLLSFLLLVLISPGVQSQEHSTVYTSAGIIGETNQAAIEGLRPFAPVWAAVGSRNEPNFSLVNLTGDPEDLLHVRGLHKGSFTYLGDADDGGELNYSFVIPAGTSPNLDVYIQVWSTNSGASGNDLFGYFSDVVLLKPNDAGEWRDNEDSIPDDLVHSAHAVINTNQFGGAEQVLITGGVDTLFQVASDAFVPTDEAWMWDTDFETITSLPRMNSPRAAHTATRLADGRVLIVGGVKFQFENAQYYARSLDSAEIWDPAVGKFESITSMNRARSYHEAVLLDDGRVLVIGGTTSSLHQSFEEAMSEGDRTTEIYDPLSDSWVYGPYLPGQTVGGGVAKSTTDWETAIGTHQIMIAGGFEDGVAHGKIYGFDAQATNVRTVGTLVYARACFSMVGYSIPAQDGHNGVFVGGGFKGTVLSAGGLTVLNTSELYLKRQTSNYKYEFFEGDVLPTGLAMGSAVQGLHSDLIVYMTAGVDQLRSGGRALNLFEPLSQSGATGRTSNHDHGGGIVVMVGDGRLGALGGLGTASGGNASESLTPGS